MVSAVTSQCLIRDLISSRIHNINIGRSINGNKVHSSPYEKIIHLLESDLVNVKAIDVVIDLSNPQLKSKPERLQPT